MSNELMFSGEEAVRYFRIERQLKLDPTTLKPRIEITFSIGAEFLMDKSTIYGADKVVDITLNQLKSGLIKVLSEGNKECFNDVGE